MLQTTFASSVLILWLAVFRRALDSVPGPLWFDYTDYIYIYMIILILLDFINEESVFCYEVQSPSVWSSPAIGIKPYWSFPEFVERMLPSLRPHVSINSSWKTSRLDAEVLDTASIFPAITQNSS